MIIAVGVAFSALYSAVIEKDFQNNMLHEVKEVINEHVVVKDNQIYFKRDSNNGTLSSHLRDDEFSALILDKNLTRIATYGVYRSNSSGESVDSRVNRQALGAILQEGIPRFSIGKLHEDKQYMTITYPITSGTQILGVISLSKESDYINHLFNISRYILLFIFPLGILGTWLASYLLTKNLFKPLDKILFIANNIHAENMSKRIKTDVRRKDEFSQLSKTLNSMLDRIDDGVRKQRNFISNASHELKTPLAKATSSLDIALMNIHDKQVHEAEKEIYLVREDILGLGGIVDSLLFLSKINDTKSQKKDIINVVLLMNGVIKRYENEFRDRDINVVFIHKEQLQIHFLKEHFEILVSNLISNAIKYTPNGGSVTLSFQTSNSGLKLVIEDNGAGIEKRDLEHIFDRFYRGSLNVNNKDDGYGLGMSIVKEICDVNGLKIELASSKGKGTKVSVSGFSRV